MNENIVSFAPTSTTTTKETEPEVVAGISSGDLNPSQPRAIRGAAAGLGYGRTLMLLAAGLAVGYGTARWLRRNG